MGELSDKYAAAVCVYYNTVMNQQSLQHSKYFYLMAKYNQWSLQQRSLQHYYNTFAYV